MLPFYLWKKGQECGISISTQWSCVTSLAGTQITQAHPTSTYGTFPDRTQISHWTGNPTFYTRKAFVGRLIYLILFFSLSWTHMLAGSVIPSKGQWSEPGEGFLGKLFSQRQGGCTRWRNYLLLPLDVSRRRVQSLEVLRLGNGLEEPALRGAQIEGNELIN